MFYHTVWQFYLHKRHPVISCAGLLFCHFPVIYRIVPSSLPVSIDYFLKLPLYSAALQLSVGSCFHGDSCYSLSWCSYCDEQYSIYVRFGVNKVLFGDYNRR